MKYPLFFLFFGLLSMCAISAFGQQTSLKAANDAYEKFYYQEAIDLYEAILLEDPRNQEAEEKLAHAYRKINDSKNAEKWYAKVVQYTYASPQNKLYYAQSLAKNGRYQEARRWYKIYAREARSDKRGQVFGKSYEDTSHFHQDAHKYEIALAPFNSKYSDFSPAYYQGGIVFCSNRAGKKRPFQLTFNWNNTNYLDLFYVRGRVGSPEQFHEKVNSKYHEGPLTFFNAERSIIFTRNNFNKGKFGKSSDGINKLKLYQADVIAGEWDNIREFPYNDDEYSVGHPTISPDGNTLYFASDMPGGQGGTDIYRCLFQNGYWGTPENLGPNINTAGNEMFPFVDASNTLYFSSDGQPGLGGLDVFIAHNRRGRFSKPQNIGTPINSSQDDFGFIVDVDRGEGYFSSNREGGMGDDDIYSFKTETCDVYFVVVDSLNNRLLRRAQVKIQDDAQEKEIIYINENDSLYSFRTGFRASYTIQASAEGFADGQLHISEEALLDCHRTGNSKDTLRVYLNPPMKTNDPNDPSGKDPAKTFSFVNTNPEKSVPGHHRRNIDPSQIIQIENIYYDLDKYFIRPDAVISLNKLLTILYQDPETRVLLSSHTDSRANYDYNIRLSQRRSNAAFQYLVNRGIRPSRIEIDYFGETRLITPCPDGIQCSEDQHQLNRRTEILLLRE